MRQLCPEPWFAVRDFSIRVSRFAFSIWADLLEKRRSDEVSYRLWIRFTRSRCSLVGCTVLSETAKRLVRKALLAGVQEFMVQQQV